MLNRLVRWESDSIECEADSKQCLLVMEHFGVEQESNVLEEEWTVDRGVTARANYLAVDRPDIQFAAKEACPGMSMPGEGAFRPMKRLARHLKGRRRQSLEEQTHRPSGRLSFTSDSDWARCKTSRKSTNGGMLVLGGRGAHEVVDFDSWRRLSTAHSYEELPRHWARWAGRCPSTS